MVEEGLKGVLARVLDPGTYYLNPYIYNTVEVNLQSQRFEMSGKDVTLALALQNTSDAVGYLPEDRISFGASMELLKATTLGVELWFDEDYKEGKGGSGNDSNALIVQVETVF